MIFVRFSENGKLKTISIFGHGMLDLLDDVFLMLPFSSRKQSGLILQEKKIGTDIWVTRREQIC